MLRPALTTLLLASALLLAACDSAEERAEKHLASAQDLMEAGDPDRALVELRNVFKLDEDHKEARLLYAGIMRDRGDLAEAAASLTMVAEQDPENAAVQARLARLAITLRDREAATRHATRAYELDPAPVEHRALYATATLRGDDRDGALDLARGVLEEDPGNLLAHTTLISDRMDSRDYTGALAQTDTALALNPDDLGLHVIRLTMLEQLERQDDVGDHLEAMVARFPENTQIEQNLIRWYIREGRSDQAEAALRAHADAGEARDVLILARFLMRLRDADAALSELDLRIAGASGTDRSQLVRARAAIAYEAGDRDGAIAMLEGLTNGAEASDDLRISQVTLARMYAGQNRDTDAQNLIEGILADDPDMVEALKVRAGWLIDTDDTDGAIRDLRRALEQAPQDAGVLTLMAQAHEREGAYELAGERLALAVQASGAGREQSLRYANFLLRNQRTGPAESIVIDALRQAPEDRQLLSLLGRIHLIRKDFDRVTQVAALLERQDDTEARAAANTLRKQALEAQAKSTEAIALLEGLAADGAGDARLSASVSLIQAHIRDSEYDKARGALEGLEAEFSDAPVVRLLRAGMFMLDDKPGEAEPIYQTLIEAGEGGTQPWLALYALLRRGERTEEAEALLTRGIEDTGAARLMLLRARNLEREDMDFEGAIAIYEALYARNSSNQMIANNLASMISTYRSGEDDLERAYTIARRLRGTKIPPFQDTYGWLLARRGDHEEALSYLRPAAQAMSDDPLVAYHLGVAEQDAGNLEAALETLSAALSLAEGDESLTAQMEDAQARITALKAAGDAEGSQTTTDN